MENKKEPLCVQNAAVPFCIACYISAVSTSAHRGRVTMLSRVVRTDASGRELLIVAELNGEHRGDRSGRAALQQQHHLCAHAEAQQTQRRKGRQTHRRDDQHPQPGQFPDVPVADDLLQVARGDEDAGDEHGKRGVHVAQQFQRLGDEGGHRDLQQVDGEAHHHRIQNRGTQQAAATSFGLELPLTMP